MGNKCPIHPDTDLTTAGCFRCWSEKYSFTPLKPIDNDIKIVKAIAILEDQNLPAPDRASKALRLFKYNFE